MTHAHATLPGLFEHFRDARRRRLPGWAVPLFAGCALFTALLVFAMWARSIWNTEQLDRPKHSIDLAIAPAPPPPPPPLAGGEKPVVVPNHPKQKVIDIVQPVKLEKPDAHPTEAGQGDPHGANDGEKGGTGTTIGGLLDSPPLPQPPPVQVTPPPAAPKAVPPAALEAQRIAGEKLIVPDDVTKTEIQRSGKDALSGTFKFCLDAAGNVLSVQIYRPTGFAAYDTKIVSTIQHDWRYRPFLVNGQATPVCTAVTFRYSQK
jgi:hypothetical protein